MLHNLYAVYDTKARAWLEPWLSHNHDTARRSFTQAANDPNHNFNRWPLDYALYHIGNYDDSNGVIEKAPPENLGLADNYKEPKHGNGTTQPA